MINTAAQLAAAPPEVHACVTIRTALPDGKDIRFIDHLQKKYREQLGMLPTQALEAKIGKGQISLAMENDEPAAYIMGNGHYMRDPHFGIIYQAAVSYDARRRLLGTALVQHFIDHAPGICDVGRLIGLWCAQDIEANEFWSACGFEAIAARHGSQRRGRVHIFWVGRTPRGRHEALRYPRVTRGGQMRATREVFGIDDVAVDGSGDYTKVVLPPAEAAESGKLKVESGKKKAKRALSTGRGGTLAEAQRAFRYGKEQRHVCVVIAGQTKYLPVAPLELPDFVDLARVFVAAA